MIVQKILRIGIFMVRLKLNNDLDHRLYKQSIQNKKSQSSNETWTLIADKSTEWIEFTESLRQSTKKNDKKLHSYLSSVLEDVIPFLEVSIILIKV